MKQKTKTQLNIDVVNRYYYPVTAGIETFLINIYPALAKKGWNINMHVSRNTLSKKNILNKSEAIKGINVQRYDMGLFGFFPYIKWSETNIVSINNFDIFPHFFILTYCFLLKIFKKKKFRLVLIPQGGFFPDWSTFSLPTGKIKKFYHDTLGAILINNIPDYLLTISEWEKAEFIKNGITKPQIITIPSGIEEEAFRNHGRLENKNIKEVLIKTKDYIIQIGRIHPIKNYDTSILAMTKIPDNIKLLIIGPTMDSQYKKRLQTLIHKLKLQNRIIFLGVVSIIDKYYLIKHAKIMIHTSLNESFCHAVNEGLSQGQICIVANNTNLQYLIKNGENGFLYETHNYNELAEKIMFALRNKNSRNLKQIKERAKKQARKLSWKNVANKMNTLYQSIV